ncbi:MAG: XkdQ/YqbQ family protein, partial [Solirubrobacterales bacterium]
MASKTVEKAREGQGRKERSNSEVGQLRAPNLNALYTQKLRNVEAGEFEFRVVLVRPEKPAEDRLMILDRAVTAINWTEESPVVSGSITVQRPSPLAVHSVPIREYHRIRLLVHWAGSWFRLWELRVNSEPEPSSGGEMTIDLVDPLAALRQNERDWEFKKDKHRPKGWTPEEIVRYVARKEGIELGKIAKGKAQIKKLKMTGSGLDVIMRTYARERQKTGRKFVIRFRNGKLEIVPIERHKVLYEIKGVILD